MPSSRKLPRDSFDSLNHDEENHPSKPPSENDHNDPLLPYTETGNPTQSFPKQITIRATIALILLSIALTSAIFTLTLTLSNDPNNPLTTKTPPNAPHKLLFAPSPNFLGPPTPTTEKNWRSLLPLGRGFVQTHTHPAEYRSVAAFHQFHCVHLTQRYFHQADTQPYSITAHDREHAYHCIEYIRQAVMCFADPTLDAVEINGEDEGGQRMNSGWGGEHVCRDWGALREWTEGRRYTNASYPDSF